MQLTFRQPLLITLMLCAVSLTAQEYRYELGGYVGAASYLGEANRRIPFVPIGGTGGAAFRYNHNFRLAFSGELGYSFLPFDCRYAQTDYPQVREARQASRGASHLLALNGWVEYNFAHYSDKFRYLQTRSLVPSIGAVSGRLSRLARWLSYLGLVSRRASSTSFVIGLTSLLHCKGSTT